MGLVEKFKIESKKGLPVTNLTEGIENIRIKDVALYMFKLARELKERALGYDTILSDDASGRLVSLFLKRVFDGLRKKQNQPPVGIRFIASGRWLSAEKPHAIKDLLFENKEKLGKVLLVTEYIETGKSIAKIVKILNSFGIDFDLAALTVSNVTGRVRDLRRSGLRGDFFFGNESYERGGMQLHGKSSLSGVTKNTESGSPFPERFKDKTTVEEKRLRVQEVVNRSRKDIDNLAKKTIELLEK